MVTCIRRWKVAGADARPIGILVYSYKPKSVVNAVLCWSQESLDALVGAQYWEWGWGVEGKQVGSMEEEQNTTLKFCH